MSVADNQDDDILESLRGVAGARAIDAMGQHFKSVCIAPNNHMHGNWICLESAKGKVFVRLVADKGILSPPLQATSFVDALYQITQLEPLLAKMEAKLGLMLQPKDIGAPANTDVLLRLSDGDCIADLALPLSLLTSLPNDILPSDDLGSLALNICLNMPDLSAGDLSDLGVGDIILWPEADAKQFGYLWVEDFTWPIQAILPELQPCNGGNSDAESDVQLRWHHLRVPVAFINRNDVTYSIPTTQRATLFCQNVEIAQVQLHMMGAVPALLVTEFPKN